LQGIVNFFLGSVLLEIHSSYPERFFNLCARSGIEFWDMSVEDIGVFRVRMTVAHFRNLAPVAKRAMCRVHIIEKSGLPFFTNKFRKRGVLVFGFIVFCFVAWIFTSFVWVMEIDGYPGLDIVQLKEVLSESGLYVGAHTKSVNISELKNNVLIEMPELSYISVNFIGSHAHVTARKRTSPPEILPENVPCDIIADKDGVIFDITVKSGTPEVLRGDAVIRGQLLASGYMTGRAGSTVITHADADIRARTWQKKSARIQKNISSKIYTGEEKSLYTIIAFNKRIKLYINSGISYVKCDKIIKKTDLEFSDGIKLPLALEKATYREYDTENASMEDDVAYDYLSKGLHSSVNIEDGAELVKMDFKTSSDDKFAYGSITAECIEKIGKKREIPKDG